ncbi:hypothetical protein DENSPDRAFT_279674 [Dentipellis sp. KUC8613]|nr:hypothetical protein DENSPDRAFT_279674 [Dentipellis sp. KUC8613]
MTSSPLAPRPSPLVPQNMVLTWESAYFTGIYVRACIVFLANSSARASACPRSCSCASAAGPSSRVEVDVDGCQVPSCSVSRRGAQVSYVCIRTCTCICLGIGHPQCEWRPDRARGTTHFCSRRAALSLTRLRSAKHKSDRTSRRESRVQREFDYLCRYMRAAAIGGTGGDSSDAKKPKKQP